MNIFSFDAYQKRREETKSHLR